jgi:hypothetical protein
MIILNKLGTVRMEWQLCRVLSRLFNSLENHNNIYERFSALH